MIAEAAMEADAAASQNIENRRKPSLVTLLVTLGS